MLVGFGPTEGCSLDRLAPNGFRDRRVNPLRNSTNQVAGQQVSQLAFPSRKLGVLALDDGPTKRPRTVCRPSGVIIYPFVDSKVVPYLTHKAELTFWYPISLEPPSERSPIGVQG